MLEELFVEINVNDYLESHGIKEDKDLKIEHLKEIARIMSNTVFSHGHAFSSISGWLTWLYGVYLQEAFDVLKKDNPYKPLEKLSMTQEQREIARRPDEFKYLVEHLLGYKYKDGEFVKNYDKETHLNKEDE